MTRREYGQQSCGLACALDRIGERWSLLIARELSLGPLRFSELARAVGGAPTDVLTKRLRDLERDGIVARRELEPPASGAVYELTELGRGLERPMIELSRWGLNFQGVEQLRSLPAAWLANALRIVLQPPARAELTIGLRSEGHSFRVRIEDGWIAASRGEAPDADVTLSGSPRDVALAVVTGTAGESVKVDGDREALRQLPAMVVVPERLFGEVLAEAGVEVAVP
jgi:DNA-binding HxlR family transcriptional regulator